VSHHRWNGKRDSPTVAKVKSDGNFGMHKTRIFFIGYNEDYNNNYDVRFILFSVQIHSFPLPFGSYIYNKIEEQMDQNRDENEIYIYREKKLISL
jgi:hypothetical protein